MRDPSEAQETHGTRRKAPQEGQVQQNGGDREKIGGGGGGSQARVPAEEMWEQEECTLAVGCRSAVELCDRQAPKRGGAVAPSSSCRAPLRSCDRAIAGGPVSPSVTCEREKGRHSGSSAQDEKSAATPGSYPGEGCALRRQDLLEHPCRDLRHVCQAGRTGSSKMALSVGMQTFTDGTVFRIEASQIVPKVIRQLLILEFCSGGPRQTLSGELLANQIRRWDRRPRLMCPHRLESPLCFFTSP